MRVLSCLIVCLFLAALLAAEEKRREVPAYTNEDLLRVSPYRDQTGVASTPAVAPSAVEPGDPWPERQGRGEGYWRREAERFEARLRPLRSRAAELRRKIEERSRKVARTLTDPLLLALQRSLEDVEAQIRDGESRFEERARREGALPGWLR